MEIETIFQVDSYIVQTEYSGDNFLTVYNYECDNTDTCTVYFSSNNIYFPNDEESFTKKIIEKNMYEWYNTRNPNCYKHIFIRDIKKQWYLSGISDKISSPYLLLDFLRKETSQLKVTMIGSSAGGYAAVLYGSLLNVDLILSFNGQFEINSLLSRSSEKIDPLVFRLKDSELRKYYDLLPFINRKVDIFYFSSTKSSWDIEQFNYVKHIDNVNIIRFKTSHHGIPFFKEALPKVLSMDKNKLIKYTRTTNFPLIFTIRQVGLISTIIGGIKQILNKIRASYRFQ